MENVFVLCQNDEEKLIFESSYKKANMSFNYTIIYSDYKLSYPTGNNNIDSIKNKFYKNNFYENRYKKLNEAQYSHYYSFIKIFNIAIENNYNKICILEYDVYFHKNFNDKIKSYSNIIKNSDIIYLGCSQHQWYNLFTGDKIEIIKLNLNDYIYKPLHSLGTFGIILSIDVIKDFLQYEIKYPTDVMISILSYKYKSFVLYPNIVICNIYKSSILNDRDIKTIIKFKWNLNNYIT
jgi:GR25 family glycosyltransferase involved in LPS biosynthesis